MTQWPEPLPCFGPAVFTQVLLQYRCRRNRQPWKSPTINYMLWSRSDTCHFHFQPMGDQSWPYGSNCWEAEQYHPPGAKRKAQTEVCPIEGLSDHTHNMPSTGATCLINRAKVGRKGPEQGRREEKKNKERSMEEIYRRKLDPEPKPRRPQGPATGVLRSSSHTSSWESFAEFSGIWQASC